MAVKDFLLPDFGEGLTEAEIVMWLVAVGDVIELNQAVAEVETAKAVVEVPSPFAGRVTALHGDVGAEVEVGTPLVTIDVDAAAPADAPSGQAGEVAANAGVTDAVPSAEPAVDDAGSGNVLVGYGTTGARTSRRRRAAGDGSSTGPAPSAPAGPATAGPAPAGPGPRGRPLAKPPVRKLAKDLGIDLAALRGSGPEGVVTRGDVHAAARLSEERTQPAPAAVEAGSPSPTAAAADRIPLRGVRKAIADKMSLSRREIPEATSWVDCDATALWELRQELNASQSAVAVSPLAIILRACVAGLRDFPGVNSRLDVANAEIVLQRHVNLGVAAQTDRGLIVPVIADAHAKSTLQIAAELNRLAAAARDGTVTPAEMTGGTFTVSNYGSFGVDGGSPVINFPEAAILGVGRIADRPWVHDGEIRVRKVVQLSIAFDHRICDGGEAAGFLRFVADCVESPTKLLSSL